MLHQQAIYRERERLPADTPLSPLRPHSAHRSRSPDRHRGSGFRQLKRLLADARVAPKRTHSARRSCSPGRHRVSGSQEMESCRPDERGPKKRRLRFKSSTRRPLPSCMPCGVAARRDGPAKQQTPGYSSADQSERSAPALKRLKSVALYVPPGARAENQPFTQLVCPRRRFTHESILVCLPLLKLHLICFSCLGFKWLSMCHT